MNKFIRNDMVAVLVSVDYGSGWSTWNSNHPELMFDPKIVEMVLGFEEASDSVAGDEYLELYNRFSSKVMDYVERTYEGAYAGGVTGLTVKWVPVGERFRIKENDGSESILFEYDQSWITA